MKKEIIYVADIGNDIDDVIAIEYLLNIGLLKSVVLDGKSRDYERESELEKNGVIFETEIPKESKILFCGGALTKINEFIKYNKIDLLVANGGFAGTNIVNKKNVLDKFKNKEKIRTYNFNMDIDATLNVIHSNNINQIILVSKNVCHSELNCIDKIHTDTFLDKYNLNKGKRLHDLLMVKEGVNYILGNKMNCDYLNVIPICERNIPNNMSIWGSEQNNKSNVKISISLKL